LYKKNLFFETLQQKSIIDFGLFQFNFIWAGTHCKFSIQYK